MSNQNKVLVQFCMGSSCFARGNSNALAELESFIEDNGLGDRVALEGHLCTGRCNEGPFVSINGKEYSGVSSELVFHLIEKALEE